MKILAGVDEVGRGSLSQMRMMMTMKIIQMTMIIWLDIYTVQDKMIIIQTTATYQAI